MINFMKGDRVHNNNQWLDTILMNPKYEIRDEMDGKNWIYISHTFFFFAIGQVN